MWKYKQHFANVFSAHKCVSVWSESLVLSFLCKIINFIINKWRSQKCSTSCFYLQLRSICQSGIRFCREWYGGHSLLCTSDLGVSNYVVTQPAKVGINNTALDGRPELQYGSWQVQSPHLAPEWNQIYPELCRPSHFASAVFRQRSSGSGVGRSDLSSGHTHRQFHTIMCFKAVASLGWKETTLKQFFFFLFS